MSKEKSIFQRAKEILNPVIRGLGYALTSLIILLAGLLINDFIAISSFEGINLNFNGEGTFIALSLWILSLPFFFIYVYNYNYEYEESSEEWVTQIVIFILSCIISVLFSIMLFSFTFDDFKEFLPYILLLVIFASLVILLSIHYYKLINNDTRFKIRNWLVIPVIFSISISFCLPFSIQGIKGQDNWLGIYLPYVLFLIYFLIMWIFQTKIDKKKYIIINIISITIIIALIVGLRLTNSNSAESIQMLLLSIILSAFMASFEAWRITWHNAQYEGETRFPVRKNPYYKATSLALLISLLIIPLLLILTHFFNLLFYALIIPLGIASCFIWFINGIVGERFLNTNWVRMKNIFGFIILIIITIDLWLRIKIPEFLFYFNDFFQLSSMFVVFTIFFYFCKSFLSEYSHYQKQIVSQGQQFDNMNSKQKFIYILRENMSNEPRNYNRLLGLLSFIPFVLLLTIDIINKSENFSIIKDTLIRMRAAELIYLFISIVCIIFDIVQKLFNFDSNTIEPPNITQDKEKGKGKTHKIIIGTFKLVRMPTCIFINLIVTVPLLLKTNDFLYSFFKGIPFMIIAMTGFALNDCMDFRKDRISKPNRAIPSNLLTIEQAILVTVFLGLLSIISSVYCFQTTVQFWLYISAFIGVLGYNFIVKYAAVIKTLCTAYICILPIVFVATMGENFSRSIILSILAFIYIVGREMRMDILDIEGDKADHIKTLPMLIGKKWAALIAQIVIYSSVLILSILLFKYRGLIIGFILSCIIFSSQVACEILWGKSKVALKRKSILLQWLPMLLACFSCLGV